MNLEGAIEEHGLHELIQTLIENREEGTLRIEPAGSVPGTLLFFEGGYVDLLRPPGPAPPGAAEEAFLSLFLLERGYFEFRSGPAGDALERVPLDVAMLLPLALERIGPLRARGANTARVPVRAQAAGAEPARAPRPRSRAALLLLVLAVLAVAGALAAGPLLRERVAEAPPAPAPAPPPPPPAPPPAEPPPPPRTAPAPPPPTDADFADYNSTRRRNAWPTVARLARRLHDSKDPRAARIGMPLQVTSIPEGAHVSWKSASGESGEGLTPFIVEAPFDASLVLRFRRAGYAPAERTVKADSFQVVDAVLARGGTWAYALHAPIAGIAAAPGGRSVVAVTRPGTVSAVALEDGALAWERTVEGEGELGPPGVAQDLILVSTREGTLVAFGPDGAPRGRTKAKPALFAPQRVDVERSERALLATSDSLLVVDAASGAVERSVPLPAAPVAPPSVKLNRAYALLADGSIAAADLAKGTLIWTADPRVQVAGAPVLVGSTLYLAARDGQLVAVSLSNGSVAWRRSPARPGPADLGLTADEARLVTASSARLVAFDGKDGKQLWEEPLSLVAPTVRFSGRLFAPLASGEVGELDVGGGKVVARYAFEGAFVAMVGAGHFLVVASGSNLEAIDRD